MKPDGIPARGLQLRSLVTEHQTVEVSLVEADVPSPGRMSILLRRNDLKSWTASWYIGTATTVTSSGSAER